MADEEQTVFCATQDEYEPNLTEDPPSPLPLACGSALKKKFKKAFFRLKHATTSALEFDQSQKSEDVFEEDEVSAAENAAKQCRRKHGKSEKKYKRKSSLNKHVLPELTQDEMNPSVPIFGSFECVICRKFFHKKDLLEKHFRIHAGDRSFRCPSCIKPSSWRVIMAQAPVPSSSDPQLDTAAAMEDSAAKGATIAGERSPPKKAEQVIRFRYKCYECRVKYTTIEKLNKHMNKRHNKRLDCVICGKIFEKESKLKRHCRQHPWDHVYRCDLCGRPWLLNDSLPVPAYPAVLYSPRPSRD